MTLICRFLLYLKPASDYCLKKRTVFMRIRSPSLTANCEETLQKGLRPTCLLRSRLQARHALRDEPKTRCVTSLKTVAKKTKDPREPTPPLSLTRTHNYTFKPRVVSCLPRFRSLHRARWMLTHFLREKPWGRG